jgi:aspartate/methionine/tyrosine aminotransferase
VRTMPEFQLKGFFNQPAAATARANLSPSFAEPLGTEDLLALEPGAAERLVRLPLGYTAAFGGLELRSAIAARYATVGPDEVVASCGGDDALPSLFMALLEPGDHLIVQSPVYQPLTSIATWCGAEVTLWAADEAAGWAPPLDALAGLLRPTTRMIVTNFPHSPTGFMPDRAYLDALLALADDAGVLLVGDEIYRGLPLDGREEAPSLADLSARAVVLNSVSKAYGLPGLRVGWLATHDAAIREAVRAFRMHANTFIGAPNEFLATLAVRQTDTILARNVALAQRNLALLDDAIVRYADRLAWVRPTSGVIGFPRWRGVETTTVLSARLLRDHGLLVAPSTYFAGGEHHLRLGFGTAGFAQGLALLEAALLAGGL